MGDAVETFSTSELAQATGVNIQTVRYYEREGLLPKAPRTSGGFRVFPPESANRVRFIKRAQDLGFSLDEVKELLDLREHPETACPEVLRRAESKMADIAEKVRALQRIQRELARLAKACVGRARPHSCPLLEALERAGNETHERSRDGTSARSKKRSVESRGGRDGRDRGVDLLHRTAGAAGARRRRRVGQRPEST